VLAVEVARLTAAAGLAETRPGLAETLVPRSPDALMEAAMSEVGQAAAVGRVPPLSAMRRLGELQRRAPLDPQPYLVEAAIAQRSGDMDRAERLLVEARRLDPRSAAARYLLADVWLRQGRVVEGLGEMATLGRLVRGSAVELVPALAEYAKTPGAAAQLAKVLQANPHLKQPLLSALAADPDNAGLIIELHGASGPSDDAKTLGWQKRLLDGLVQRGSYERAYQLWRRFSGTQGGRPLLFNEDYSQLAAPPPFNWAFASGRGGFAEPGNGSMRVLHYGREDVSLASQLLLLPPGRYRFSAPVSGSAAAGALAWVLACSGGKTLFEISPEQAGSVMFEVPAGDCPAQQLALRGRALDAPQESDVRVGRAKIERVAA
jgi:tetratricopeptide (TPR) repeat protein